MIKHILAAAALTAAIGLSAQDATPDYSTMYLIKGDRVVTKLHVDDVDYVSFKLPEGVVDSKIDLTVNQVGKNTITYTVSTQGEGVAYAHNLVSYYDANYLALNYLGDMIDNLEEADKILCIQSQLAYDAYMGMGTDTYTMRDYTDDGTGEGSFFHVIPGTHYYVCAWEIDPVTGEALDTFVMKEIDTEAPGASTTANVDVTLKGTNAQGAALNFSGNCLYLQTAWGIADIMNSYAEAYGFDFLINTFGQRFDLAFLQGTGDEIDGIENATWPLNGSQDYVMMVRAWDENGDKVDYTFPIHVDEAANAGPEIKIFSKEKSQGHVSVNFEITPSNVTEAYVRMMDENTLDDRLNMGYELYELAMGGDATDITESINTLGEYTFTSNNVPEGWQSLLIYAKDTDGNRSTLRLSFSTLEGSEWADYPIVHAPKRVLKAPARIRAKATPILPKVARKATRK